jgi:hypothetical protein
MNQEALDDDQNDYQNDHDSDVEIIEDAGVPSRRVDEMELSDIDCSAEEERVSGLLNEKEKIKELEKRL